MAESGRDSERPTSQQALPLSVVVVGGPESLIDAARATAGMLTDAAIHHCELADAATTVAIRRPFAIVVSEALYVFDDDEFDALARDVSGKLLVIDVDSKTPSQIEDALLPGMTEAFRHFRRA